MQTIMAFIASGTAQPWYAKLLKDLHQTFIEKDRWQMFLKGLGITVEVALLALVIGIIIGVCVAMIRATHDQRRVKKKTPGSIILDIANFICHIYLTVIRGTPMMVQLLIMYFVIFVSVRNQVVIAVIAFGINSGAYVAEIVRSGIMSIDAGQMEAGRSLGLSYGQTMKSIIIPQAFKNILPALGNEMIVLFKDTSLVTVIGLMDLTKTAQVIAGATYQAYVPLIAAAVVYLVCVIILSKILGIVERRLRAGDKR